MSDHLPPDEYIECSGEYEPAGVCISLDTPTFQPLAPEAVPVLAHEFAHYVQAISSGPGVAFLMHLLGRLHGGIMILKDLGTEVKLPLASWATEASCPPFVRDRVRDHEEFVHWWNHDLNMPWTDPSPPPTESGAAVYTKDGISYVRIEQFGIAAGVPVGFELLGEGMAVAAACESVDVI